MGGEGEINPQIAQITQMKKLSASLDKLGTS
jgi:hypothetical protein